MFTKQAVSAAIFHNDKLLIVKRLESESDWAGYWEIPGGGVDAGETLEQGLHREIAEETQLKISAAPQHHYYFTHGKTEEYHFVATCADITPLKLEPTEHDDYRWIASPEDVNTLKMSPEMAEGIKQAFRHKP